MSVELKSSLDALESSQHHYQLKGTTGKSSLTISGSAVWSWGCISAIDAKGRTIWIADAHRDDGKRFVVRADESWGRLFELERQVLTVTFYLESIRADSGR